MNTKSNLSIVGGPVSDQAGAPPASPEPKPLEDDAWYVVELRAGETPGEVPIRTIVRHRQGHWYVEADRECFEDDGPIPVDFANYTVIRKIDLWEAVNAGD